MSQIDWKFRELIAALGGPESLRALLEKGGYSPPPAETIKGWRFRNSIPGKYLPAVLIIAQQKKVLRRLENLRVRGK